MKKFLFAILASFAFVATALAVSASIIGSWQASIENRGSKYTLQVDIGEPSSKFTITCALEGQTGTVSIDVPTKVEGNTFHILGSATQEKKVGSVNCKVSVSPVSYNVEASDKQLKVSTPDGRSVFLTRAVQQ